MRISAIGNNYYRNNNINFGEKEKRNGMLKGAKVAVGAMAASAVLSGGMQSCDKLDKQVHNHYIEWPTSTPDPGELKPVPTPPQIIIVEKEVIVEKPGKNDTIVHHDTVYLKPDTAYIKEDWKSKVPPKQQEIYDNLAITPQGNGKFFIKDYYYDKKNYTLVQRKLDGQSSSRNGDVLVYNVIKTKWDDASEGVVEGKNETYEKHLMFLSDDGKLLGIKAFVPKNNVNFENNEGKSNWSAFKDEQLSKPDKWKDSYSTYMEPEGLYVSTDEGFKLMGKDGEENTVTVFNPYNSEWDLTNFNTIKGDAD